jgi:hypothetical protein
MDEKSYKLEVLRLGGVVEGRHAAFVFAVDRSAIPHHPFHLRHVSRTRGCPECRVLVRYRYAGAVGFSFTRGREQGANDKKSAPHGIQVHLVISPQE